METHDLVERTRQAMVRVRSSSLRVPTPPVALAVEPETAPRRHKGRALSAYRYARQHRITNAEAARLFGVARSSLTTEARRAGAPPLREQPNRRAELAAKHVHDASLAGQACTRWRAAQIYSVSEAAVIAAWERTYPNERRIRVG